MILQKLRGSVTKVLQICDFVDNASRKLIIELGIEERQKMYEQKDESEEAEKSQETDHFMGRGGIIAAAPLLSGPVHLFSESLCFPHHSERCGGVRRF